MVSSGGRQSPQLSSSSAMAVPRNKGPFDDMSKTEVDSEGALPVFDVRNENSYDADPSGLDVSYRISLSQVLGCSAALCFGWPHFRGRLRVLMSSLHCQICRFLHLVA